MIIWCQHFVSSPPYRALEVWGSWRELESLLEKRKLEREEEDRRRQGLSSLIAYLKKINKDQIRKVQDAEVCDGVGVGLGLTLTKIFRHLEESKKEYHRSEARQRLYSTPLRG